MLDRRGRPRRPGPGGSRSCSTAWPDRVVGRREGDRQGQPRPSGRRGTSRSPGGRRGRTTGWPRHSSRARPAHRRPGRAGSPHRARPPSPWCPATGTASASACRVCTSGIERGRVSRLPSCVFMPSAGAARATSAVSDDDEGRDRTAYDGGQDAAAEAALADPPVEPPQQREPRTVDPSAELGQQRGQHGDGADDCHADHDDGAGGERVEGRTADDEQAGHRADHGPARHQDRVTRRRGGDLDGVEGAVTGGAFLTLALEVEQRVVDADRHPDQHDHAGHRGLGVDQVRERGGDAHRGGDRCEREQHRDPGRDQRAEGEQHQQQGDREADPLGGVQVLGDAVVDGGVDRDVAGLADAQVRMRAGDGCRGAPGSAAASSMVLLRWTSTSTPVARGVPLGCGDLGDASGSRTSRCRSRGTTGVPRRGRAGHRRGR